MSLIKNVSYYFLILKSWFFSLVVSFATGVARFLLLLSSMSPETALSQKIYLGNFKYKTHRWDDFSQFMSLFASKFHDNPRTQSSTGPKKNENQTEEFDDEEEELENEITYYDTENSEWAKFSKKSVPRGIDKFNNEFQPKKEESRS